MAFTQLYLERCWANRKFWSQKAVQVGDWYLTMNPPKLAVVAEQDADQVTFVRDDIAYVPDTDDLLELLDNQIKACKEDPRLKIVEIRCDAEEQWSVRITYGDWTTVAVQQESIQSALLYALFQMALPSIQPLDIASEMRQTWRQRELPRRKKRSRRGKS